MSSMDGDNSEYAAVPVSPDGDQIVMERASPLPDNHLQQSEPFKNLGCICASELRVPLVMRDSYSLRSRSMYVNGAGFEDDSRGSAIFCVVRVGEKVCMTSLSKTALHLVTDVTFEEVVRFENVEPNFKCTIEVYFWRDHASTLRRASRKLKNSVNLPRYRAEQSASDRLSYSHQDLINRSECLGRVTLNIDDVEDMVRSHCLTPCEPVRSGGHRFLAADSSAKCPTLFGQICCRLTAAPYLHSTDICQETLHTMIGDRLSPAPMNVQLSGSFLSVMKIPPLSSTNGYASSMEDTDEKPATQEVTELIRLPVNKNMIITSYSGGVVPFKNRTRAAPLKYCVELQNQHAVFPNVTLCLTSRQSQRSWSHDLNQAVECSKTWGRAGETRMTLPLPLSVNTWPASSRNISLYNEVGIPEDQQVKLFDGYSSLSSASLHKNTLNYKFHSTLSRWGTFRASRLKM